MSQHDYVIDNQTFPATRTDLNNALAAIVSTNAGATAPSTTYAYQLWYDTTADKLKMRNADDDAWIDLFDVNQTTDVAEPTNLSSIDLNGNELILDANGDTSITADTDDQIDFKTGGTDRMTIDSSGNVGIGTSSPSYKLVVSNNGGNGLEVRPDFSGDTETRINSYNRSGGNYTTLSFDTGVVKFRQFGTSDAVTIDSSGNLLVGATSPIASGKITAQATGTNPAVVSQGASDCFQGRTTQTSGTSYFAYWLYNGSNVGSITSTGSTTSYNTSSDYRLKENVTDITGATNRLKQLNPVRFNFIADADTTVDGFLAHEVQTVVPEAITGTHNQVEVWTQEQIDAGEAPENTSAGDNKLDDDGNTIPVYQGIDQSKLVPLLVATIQELEARIAALEAN